MASVLGEDTVKTVEMTTKNLEYYINKVDKAGEGSEKTAILKEVLLSVKFYQTALYAAEKSFLKESFNHCLIFRNCYGHPSLQATTTPT